MKFKALALLLLPLTALALVLAMIEKRPRPTEFCAQCVMRRDVEEWRIGSRLLIREQVTLAATPLSQLLESKRVTTAHEHQWVARHLAKEAVDQTGEIGRAHV